MWAISYHWPKPRFGRGFTLQWPEGRRGLSSLHITSSRKHSLISQSELHNASPPSIFSHQMHVFDYTSASLAGLQAPWGRGTCPLHFLGTGSGPKWAINVSWTTEDSNVTKVDSCFLSKLKKQKQKTKTTPWGRGWEIQVSSLFLVGRDNSWDSASRSPA